jgi:hypothetical protein
MVCDNFGYAERPKPRRRDRARARALAATILGAASALLMLTLVASAGARPAIPGTSPVNIRQTANALRDGDPLLPFATESGLISLSLDAIGTNNPEGGPIMVHKNVAGATVRKAYLFAASTGETGYTPVNGDVTIDGTPVDWNPANTIANDINSVNVEADVTSIVEEKINKAPAGNVEFNVAEPNNTDLIDGEILAVVLNDPSVKQPNSVTLLYGAQNPFGDSFHVGLAEPIDKSNPEFALNLSLGISYGYETTFETAQFSNVTANGKSLTHMAGGQDDCVEKYSATPDFADCENGELITVGGIGDSTNDPNPNETIEECALRGEPVARCDDELYSLLPFVNNGETELTFETDNPSDNDNIFFAALETHANAAVIGEGITLSPTTATNKLGELHTLTATVQNEKGEKLSGKEVHFEIVSGPNAGLTGEGTTNASGQTTFSYTSSKVGTDHIIAKFVNAEGETETSNEALKTWIEETSSSKHWFSDGELIGEGEPVPILASGGEVKSVTLHTSGASISCLVAAHGSISNPLGGSAGTDEITGFEGRLCDSHKYCKKQAEMIGQNLPWHSHLEGEPVRDVIEGVTLQVVCDGVVVDTYTGTLSPIIGESKAEFGPGSGELEDASGNKASVTGFLKLKGPKHDKKITAG